MNPVARGLVVLGAALILGGLVWELSNRLGLGLGRLPGDFSYEKPGFKFYFPLTTSLLISAAISLVFWLFRLLKK